MTMTVHNYRSRQVHETLNGVNPSNGFRDMRSAKSGPNLCQIWQVFGPWASPYGANGQMNMTVHNYRPRQFHRTSNGENPSSGYRDMGSASLAAARPPGPWRQYPSSPEGWRVKISLELIFKAKLKLESGNQKIQYGHQAAILKVTTLKINRLLPMTTINMHMKFEIEILKQTWLTSRKPCHLQSPETEKSNMVARRPFWKWLCWKSIGSYPYT